MSDEFVHNRREFIGNVVKGTLGGAVVAWGGLRADAQGVAPPANVRVLTNASSKSLITPSDLTYRGYSAFPSVGDPYSAGPGSTDRTLALGIRYDGGTRKYLLAWFRSKAYDPSGKGLWNGNLVEYQEPTATLYGSGSGQTTPTAAPTMVPTGRVWTDWIQTSNLPAQSNGVEVVNIIWDDTYHGIWYTLNGWYTSAQFASIGFTQLNDDGTTVKYGLWYYKTGSTGGFYWKQVNGSWLRIPASSQVGSLVGHPWAWSGSYSSVSGAIPDGPGMIGMPGLFNPTTYPADSVIPAGVPIAVYDRYDSPMDSSGPYQKQRCRRLDNDCDALVYPGNSTTKTGADGVARWQPAIDCMNSMVWLEGKTKEGIIGFGRQAVGSAWYSDASTVYLLNRVMHDDQVTPVPGAAAYTDPFNRAKGYRSTGARAALYVVNPAHVREVALGQRSPYSGPYGGLSTWMQPAAVYDWSAKWPNIPWSRNGNYGPYIDWSATATGYYDSVAKQVIWYNPRCFTRSGYDLMGCVHFFDFPDA